MDWLRLTALAAIWGGSFVLMRVAAPVFGAFWTADLRLLIAGAVLIAYLSALRLHFDWASLWKRYLLVGVINSALPFCLFSFAISHLPASYTAVLNSSTPLFGTVFSAIWLGERLGLVRIAGLILGAGGVALVVGFGHTDPGDPLLPWAVAACLGAAILYGISGVYLRLKGATMKPSAVAAASQFLSGLLFLPLAASTPFPSSPSVASLQALLALAVLCSGVAYLLYYRLIADVGPARTLTVTFLVPVFGILWATLFLGEPITGTMLLGAGLVITGTVGVVRG